MTFSEFIQICHLFMGSGCKKYEYPQYISHLFMAEPPESGIDAERDEKEQYYPFHLDKNSLGKIFRGADAVSKKDASKIESCFNPVGFIDKFDELPVDTREQMISDFEKKGVKFGDSEPSEILVAEFKEIVFSIAQGSQGSTNQNVPRVDARGQSIREIEPASVYLDKAANMIVIGETKIKVTPILMTDEIRPEEQKYIAALSEVYDEKKREEKLTIAGPMPDAFYDEDLQSQRQFFFDAESVYQAVRDAFQDGDQEFDIMKKEAYEGIRETYIGQYSDGFERLRQVLIKITNTSFQRTELVKFTHLIGNSEKKGICHMLVEDKRIKSWVNRF